MDYTENNFDIKIVIDYEKLQKYENPLRFFHGMRRYLQSVYIGTTCEYKYNYFDDSTLWFRNGTLAYMLWGMGETVKRNCMTDIMKEWLIIEKTERDGVVVVEEDILHNEKFMKYHKNKIQT